MNIFNKIREKLSNTGSQASSVFNTSDGWVCPPSKNKLVFSDNFYIIDRDRWRIPINDFHTSYLYDYYGGEEYVKVVDNELRLLLRHNPRTYIKSELPSWKNTNHLPEEFTIPYCVGRIITKKSWKYGWFEAEVMLPEGMNLWPAFWLSGENSWPPEIDIFEGYSDFTPRYGKKNLGDFWKIGPNLHYGNVEDGTKEMYGSYGVKVRDCTTKFVQYVCHWTPSFIRIYYNGMQVFETRDPNVLQWFNKKDAYMNVIFNHASLGESGEPTESTMRVRNFRIYQ